MANIIIKKSELSKYIPLTKENLDKIALSGISFEETKDEIMFEVAANRPDQLSLQGLTRYLRSYLGIENKIRNYKLNKPEKNFKVVIDASVKNIRPFTACAIIKDLKLNNEKIKEIIDLQEKMHSTFGRNRKRCAIGVYPLENINLPIRYTALKPEEIVFKPLESDREMNGREILEKHPTGKTYAHLLEKMPKYPLFMDASNNVLSMPPIINSEKTGRVTEKTKSVFIECSGFEEEIVQQALNILVTSLSDMGGKIFQMELQNEKKKTITPKLESSQMKFNLKDANKILGLNITEKELPKLFRKVGLDYKKNIVTIPAWRTDIIHNIDLIEDLAIAYGYDNIEPKLPEIASTASQSNKQKINNIVSNILVGLGLIEVSSFHLVKEEETKLMKEKPIELEASKTEYKHLRQSLVAPALRIISENKDNEYPQKIYEIGTTFKLVNKKIEERSSLVISLTPGSFTQTKQIVDSLIQQLGLDYEIKENEEDIMVNGRCASIIIGKDKIGSFGEINPETLRNWNIKMPVALIEISMDKLLENVKLH